MALIMNRAELAAALPEKADSGAEARLHHDRLMAEDIALIERATFLCLGTTDRKGCQTLTHASGAPGFVRVVDDRSLLVPESPGVGGFECLANILEDPTTTLLIVVPGEIEALQVRGAGSLTNDRRLLAHLEQDGGVPALALFLEIKDICRRGETNGLPARQHS